MTESVQAERREAATNSRQKNAMYGILAIVQSVSRWYKADGQYDAEKIADAMADLVLDGMVTR